MNAIPKEVLQKFGVGSDSKVPELFFYLMKELHLSYTELCEMPVPALTELARLLEKHNRKEQEAMKRRK